MKLLRQSKGGDQEQALISRFKSSIQTSSTFPFYVLILRFGR